MIEVDFQLPSWDTRGRGHAIPPPPHLSTPFLGYCYQPRHSWLINLSLSTPFLGYRWLACASLRHQRPFNSLLGIPGLDRLAEHRHRGLSTPFLGYEAKKKKRRVAIFPFNSLLGIRSPEAFIPSEFHLAFNSLLGIPLMAFRRIASFISFNSLLGIRILKMFVCIREGTRFQLPSWDTLTNLDITPETRFAFNSLLGIPTVNDT